MIKADGLTVLFPRGPGRPPIRALDGFSLEVRPGDIFALLGPNGAGKSTAMYCFLGLIKPDRGTVRVAGGAPEPGAPVFDRISYLPEEPHYHLYMTVFEAVQYYSGLYSRRPSPAQINETLDRIGLGPFRDLRLSKCSKGMKQKAGIAVCLLSQAELVLLDEPTRGLDPLMVKEFRDILLDMNRRGVTLVINSHVLSEVEMLCSRAAIINRGRVLRQDDLRSLMRHDSDRYVAEMDAADDLPPYLEDIVRGETTLRAALPAAQVADFFQFAQARGLKVYECGLKKLSLEDAFLDVLKGDGP